MSFLSVLLASLLLTAGPAKTPVYTNPVLFSDYSDPDLIRTHGDNDKSALGILRSHAFLHAHPPQGGVTQP